MNNQSTADLNVGSKQKKRHGEDRFLDANTLSAVAAMNKNPDGSAIAIDPLNASATLQSCIRHGEWKLWNEYKNFIPKAEKAMQKLTLDENDALPSAIVEFAKPISEWTKIQIETGELTMCVEVAVLVQAIKLAEARIRTVFMRHYWNYLQNGAELLKEADEEFEQMCAKLRLPRRTRAIMNKKKVSNEPVAENEN
jgi:hypothetical protein